VRDFGPSDRRFGSCVTSIAGPKVQTAMRNCTRDEGRSLEGGSQVLASNRIRKGVGKPFIFGQRHRFA
jgi:hypothetical protein